MKRKRIAQKLGGGDRRSIGKADAVAAQVQRNRRRFKELIRCLWSDDPIVRMCAADAVEKVSRKYPEVLHPFKVELLGLLSEATQQELRWHLAQMIPRLVLSERERHRAAGAFRNYLNDRSSIVKTFAIQALADIARDDPSMRPEVRALVETHMRSGTAAMRARCRKLMKQLDA
jgi:hypothetical protein